MIATVWTNGNTELGVKISAKDRDQFFKKEWSYVTLEWITANASMKQRRLCPRGDRSRWRCNETDALCWVTTSAAAETQSS